MHYAKAKLMYEMEPNQTVQNTDNKIPRTMLALRQYKAGGELFVEQLPVPVPGPGQILVKMHAAPINPSDLSQLQGTYAQKSNFPFTPGIEGSGRVVAAGKGLVPKLWKQKRVACSSTTGLGGTWAQYMLTSAMHAIPLKSNITYQQGAMLIVNPMTAMAFVEIAKKGKHKAIVNTAAASVLGNMLAKLCAKNGIKLMNIVHRNEQAEMLMQQGQKYVLNSQSANYVSQLDDFCKTNNVTLFFDAVGGSHTSVLLDLAPQKSKIIVYANLSDDNVCFDPRGLLQNDKAIGGFFLANWSAKQNTLKTLQMANRIQNLTKDTLNIPVRKCFTIENANQALSLYRNNMTGGKILFKFDD